MDCERVDIEIEAHGYDRQHSEEPVDASGDLTRLGCSADCGEENWLFERGLSIGPAECNDSVPEDVEQAIARARELARSGCGVFLKLAGEWGPGEIGQYLSSARKLAGLTQAQLGRRSNLSAGMVGRTERDPMSVKADYLFRLCAELGVAATFSFGQEVVCSDDADMDGPR